MVRSRGYAEYSTAPLRRGRGFRRRWLRTAQLNLVGWAALLGVCGVATGIGVVAARAISLPGWIGAALGVVLLLGAVVLTDRRKWSAMETSFGWGGSVDEVARIAAELQAQGVTTAVTVYDSSTYDAIADEGLPEAGGAPEGDSPPEGGDRPEGLDLADSLPQMASLSYRNRDAKRVGAVLRAHGIDSARDLW